jgi:hypothetical protein
MRRLLLVIPIALIVTGATLLFERPAYAYADPGSGLLAIQAAGSALVAIGWYLRGKIHRLFHKGSSSTPPPIDSPAKKEDEGSSLP